jgi:hypothetical protein
MPEKIKGDSPPRDDCKDFENEGTMLTFSAEDEKRIIRKIDWKYVRLIIYVCMFFGEVSN